MEINDIPIGNDLSFPVLCWSFRAGVLHEGDLLAWPNGTLFFCNRRSLLSHTSTTVDEALAIIDRYGWGEPPLIDEIFRLVVEFSQKLPINERKANEEFYGLRRDFELLILDKIYGREFSNEDLVP